MTDEKQELTVIEQHVTDRDKFIYDLTNAHNLIKSSVIHLNNDNLDHDTVYSIQASLYVVLDITQSLHSRFQEMNPPSTNITEH